MGRKVRKKDQVPLSPCFFCGSMTRWRFWDKIRWKFRCWDCKKKGLVVRDEAAIPKRFRKEGAEVSANRSTPPDLSSQTLHQLEGEGGGSD